MYSPNAKVRELETDFGSAIGSQTQWSGALKTTAAAVASVAGMASAQVGPPPDDSNGAIYKLLQRITFGFTEEEYATAVQMGFQGYLEWQLNHELIDDTAMNSRLAPLSTLSMSYYEIQYFFPMMSNYVTELQDATLIRAVFSRRQLFEKMVEFWSDHFSIDLAKVGALKVVDDRTVVRQYAMTTFPQLLRASAYSPGMLIYLDNQTSNATVPNQNYSRELLELHTLGVDNGYSQTDVSEVAKCLSGWGMHGSGAGKRWGQFLFNTSRHNNGAKTVLGTQIPSGGGIQDGETVIGILGSHPNTARRIATKLVRRFLADDPPESVVDQVEFVFLSTGGDVRQMLRTILTPENLTQYSSPRLKRPFHLIASILRASKATVTNIATSRSQLTAMGHLPFRWAPPNGYPDLMGYWSGLVLPRWNFGFSLLNGNISGASVNATALFQGLTTNVAISDRINNLLASGNLSPEDLAAVRNYMTPTETDINKIREAMALGMSSPSFQMF